MEFKNYTVSLKSSTDVEADARKRKAQALSLQLMDRIHLAVTSISDITTDVDEYYCYLKAEAGVKNLAKLDIAIQHLTDIYQSLGGDNE